MALPDRMDPSRRRVMRIPMTELWDSEGRVFATKRRTLTSKEIVGMLSQGLVRFVVANCGESLRWIPPRQCFEFWKTEVKPHIVDTAEFDQAEFPGAYCYVASEWADAESTPLVLLEMYH